MNDILDEVKEEIKSDKNTRVAINGFGRIGRMIFRAGFGDPNIEFVVINDLSTPQELAYLLKHDSAQGTFDYDVKVVEDGLLVGDKKIKVISQRDIHALPWKDNEIDVVAECTGMFTKAEDSRVHIEQGAKKVLISAPGKGECFYLVRGVNDDEYNGEDLVSIGSILKNIYFTFSKLT